MSRTARVLLVLGGFFALVGYLLVVDLGVNAGRIHYGVSVEKVDVGGLTAPEAVALLTERGAQLKQPFEFSAPGVSCAVDPEGLGWGPQPSDTMRAALAVGREHAPFGAIVDRVRAWTGGVRVAWAGAVNPHKVFDFLNDCEERAAAQGLALDRGTLRFELRRAIVTWPRPVPPLYRLPLERPV